MSLGITITPHILFIGNSHTGVGDVPGMVKKLLRGERGFEGLEVTYDSVTHLNQWKLSPEIAQRIESGGITTAVLQGAEISSSHKYTYSQEEGIELAKSLKASGAQVFYVSEWPRKGWDESEYIERVYRKMARESGGTVIPVGQVWDGVRKRLGGIELWQSDGNHANGFGSYLSARTIACWLGGQSMKNDFVGIRDEFVKVIDESIFEVRNP